MGDDGAMTRDVPLDDLSEATQRLVRTVDGLDDHALGQPSLLPGWSRAHVVAHVTLNAEGLGGVLRGIVEGRDVPMYRSQEVRDGDIDLLARADRAALRERFMASSVALHFHFNQIMFDCLSFSYFFFKRLVYDNQVIRTFLHLAFD